MDELNPEEYSNRSAIFDTLEGVELSIVAIDNRVFQHRMGFSFDKNREVKFVSGMCYELLLGLQHALKFSYKAVRSRYWIGSFPNGTMRGMAAQVINGEVDIAISQASMVMMTQALPKMSYLLPTSSGKLTAIFRQPDAHNTRDIVVPSVDLNTGMCWGLIWVFILLSLRITQLALRKFSISYSREEKTKTGEDKQKDGEGGKLLDLVTWGLSMITCQGWHSQPMELSIRAVFLASIVFAYLISIFYSGYLTSVLATEEISIATFNDLTRSSLEIYGDVYLPVVRDLVREVYKKQRGVSIPFNRTSHQFIRAYHSVKKIQNESAAFITFEELAHSGFIQRNYTDGYYCELISTVSVRNGPLLNAMFVRQGSHLKEIFNRKILIMQERGVIHRINLAYDWKTIVKCPQVSHKFRGGLGMRDVSTAFSFVIIGIVASLAGILGESCGLI